jgi:hypothetical protein
VLTRCLLVQAVVHTVDVGDVVETLVAGQCCLTSKVVFISVGDSAKESAARLEKA